ncbi:MAG: phosphoglucomutase/phosphomannomutase family protein [Chloroflexi bacterium]|nr:phosphoglucomutase/phosphomannomutase family protein [Chloroflexota bacterium]
MLYDPYPRHEIKFGTDGWRAIIAEEYTFDNVRVCAQAVADYLIAAGKAEAGLLVGYDTRFASERFAAAVAEVVAANDIDVVLLDRPQPTPVVSFGVTHRQCGGGVVITASHNPAPYNGFKYKPDFGGSAPPEIVAQLEAHIGHIQGGGKIRRLPLQEGLRSGRIAYYDPSPAYLEQLGRLVDLEAIKQAGLTIVADAMYGAGAGYFERLLSGGKTRVIGIRQERNPIFPGINPEPITPNLAELFAAVRAHGADLGLATDGDADRIGPVDERGDFVNQHQTFALLLLYLLEVRGQRGPAIRSATMTSAGDRLAKQFGAPVIETAVGFKYIGPRMMETDAILGGEESGGFGFRGHIPERDALLAGLFLADLVVKLQRPLSQVLEYLRQKVGPFAYDRLDLHFPAQEREAIAQRVATTRPSELAGSRVTEISTIDGYKFYTEDGSWLLIRFSGTEPLLRIYAETSSPERVKEFLEAGRGIAGV